MNNVYRPWGEMQWLFPKISPKKWAFIGCVSTEDRCLGAVGDLKENLDAILFYRIEDPISKDSAEIKRLTDENENRLLKIAPEAKVVQHNLLQQNSLTINSIKTSLALTAEHNVIIDITSFPKRFFFPLIKYLLKIANVKNLVVSYSTPEKYCSDELNDDPLDWEALPYFLGKYPEPKILKAIVGVGFMPLSLPRLLGNSYNDIAVSFLFPFPPGQPYHQRTWEFMRRIENSYTLSLKDKIIRVDSNDASDAYNRILSETDNGNKYSILAPYGPKPISLAICLYAINTQTPVYYTQPQYYNPHYSTGFKKHYGYIIRTNGTDLYQMPSD